MVIEEGPWLYLLNGRSQKIEELPEPIWSGECGYDPEDFQTLLALYVNPTAADGGDGRVFACFWTFWEDPRERLIGIPTLQEGMESEKYAELKIDEFRDLCCKAMGEQELERIATGRLAFLHPRQGRPAPWPESAEI